MHGRLARRAKMFPAPEMDPAVKQPPKKEGAFLRAWKATFLAVMLGHFSRGGV